MSTQSGKVDVTQLPCKLIIRQTEAMIAKLKCIMSGARRKATFKWDVGEVDCERISGKLPSNDSITIDLSEVYCSMGCYGLRCSGCHCCHPVSTVLDEMQPHVGASGMFLHFLTIKWFREGLRDRVSSKIPENFIRIF